MFDSLGSPIAYPADVSKGITPGNGRVLFVSSLAGAGGSDDNEGSDPQFPLLKIQAAIDKCAQRKHDYIFVQDSYQADVVSILINKRNVHLIGLSEGNQLGGRALVDMQGVDACFKTYGTGGSWELAGFRMGSAGQACIEMAETSFYNHIHHCSFGHFMSAQDGILNEGVVEASGWIIDHCIFSQYLTRDGIRLANDGFSIINNNLFQLIPEKCINYRGVLAHILGNVFYSPIADAEAAGWAITLESSSTNVVIVGNRAATSGTNQGNVPYLDMSTNDQDTLENGWSDNWLGNTATDPGDSDDA